MAKKINRENAEKRINEMLKGYEKRERDNRYGGCKYYYVMNEKEFNALFEAVLNACTKDLKKYIERYSIYVRYADEGMEKTFDIGTYSSSYATITIV